MQHVVSVLDAVAVLNVGVVLDGVVVLDAAVLDVISGCSWLTQASICLQAVEQRIGALQSRLGRFDVSGGAASAKKEPRRKSFKY